MRRLDAAVRKENDQSTVKDESNNNSTVGKKRDREDEDENNEDSKEISAIDKFQGMSIQMLRKKASLRGISTIGTKKELVQRLSNAAAVDDGNGTILLPFHFFFVVG